MQNRLLLFPLFLVVPLLSESIKTHSYVPEIPTPSPPWFTGSLLTNPVETTPPGIVNLEPFFYFTTYTGSYNEHWKHISTENFYSASIVPYCWIGITSFLDFELQPQFFYQFTDNAHSYQIGDLPIEIGLQLSKSSEDNSNPNIRFSLNASIPIGKYNNLDPKKLKTDSVGSGSWLPGATLAIGRIFQCSKTRFFAPELAISYIIPTRVHVKNANAYGGGKGTYGTIYPGTIFSCDLNFEYNLTKNWAFAMDMYYEHTNQTKFSGTNYVDSIGFPSSEQFSLAPAIEYNWSVNLGLIAGVWFTVAGRNSDRFLSGQIAINLYL